MDGIVALAVIVGMTVITCCNVYTLHSDGELRLAYGEILREIRERNRKWQEEDERRDRITVKMR